MQSGYSEELMKIVMLGEGRVGKTSLTLRYCKGVFDDKQVSTINASYLEKKLTLAQGKSVKLSIWDTAGQEKFQALAPMYYRDAEGAVLVYDISYRESFVKVSKWIKELREFASPDIILVVAANKCDMESERQVDKAEAELFINKFGAKQFLTSAKTGNGYSEMFEYLATKILEKTSQNKRGKKTNLIMRMDDQEQKTKKSENCC